jgi:hypothetical protein
MEGADVLDGSFLHCIRTILALPDKEFGRFVVN